MAGPTLYDHQPCGCTEVALLMLLYHITFSTFVLAIATKFLSLMQNLMDILLQFTGI